MITSKIKHLIYTEKQLKWEQNREEKRRRKEGKERKKERKKEREKKEGKKRKKRGRREKRKMNVILRAQRAKKRTVRLGSGHFVLFLSCFLAVFWLF